MKILGHLLKHQKTLEVNNVSRSKKIPIVKQPNFGFAKKTSNKRVRKFPNLSSGNSYKKIYCSWAICDFNTGPLSKEDLEKLDISEYKARMK